MIPLSPAAARQLAQLTRFYVERGRDLAIDRLVNDLERASARYLADEGSFYDAPRPYPALVRRGWRWTKEGRYWLAFGQTGYGPGIRAVFYDSENTPDRR